MSRTYTHEHLVKAHDVPHGGNNKWPRPLEISCASDKLSQVKLYPWPIPVSYCPICCSTNCIISLTPPPCLPFFHWLIYSISKVAFAQAFNLLRIAAKPPSTYSISFCKRQVTLHYLALEIYRKNGIIIDEIPLAINLQNQDWPGVKLRLLCT